MERENVSLTHTFIYIPIAIAAQLISPPLVGRSRLTRERVKRETEVGKQLSSLMLFYLSPKSKLQSQKGNLLLTKECFEGKKIYVVCGPDPSGRPIKMRPCSSG